MKKLVTTLFLLASASSAFAEMGPSGYPLPRFVSLRTDEANVRTGPGMQYPKRFVLVKKDIPLEIVSEYEDWRKIRDIQGDEGWVHKAMLSGKRTAIVNINGTNVYRGRDMASEVKAVLENGVVVDVENCDGEIFCKVSISEIEGYIFSNNVWGVYSKEKID